MILDLAVQQASKATVPEEDEFHLWIKTALTGAGRDSDAEVSLRIVDNAEMSALNGRYRGREGPTNVLSFPADLPAGVDLPLLGDIVICAPVVAAEAAAQGKPDAAHWAHLCIHGALHLLGYDHLDDDEATQMENLETRILGTLALPCPYTAYQPEEIATS